MLTHICFNLENLLSIGTLVAMEIAVAGFVKEHQKEDAPLHAQTHTYICGCTAAADPERMIQIEAVGFILLHCWLPKDVHGTCYVQAEETAR